MSQQCLECRFYSMWEGNCCFPGKNFMHVACMDECKDFEPEEDVNGSGSDNGTENAV